MKSLWVGPSEIRRRYMAGLSVTFTNFLEDGSRWEIYPMPSWHMHRLEHIMEVTRG